MPPGCAGAAAGPGAAPQPHYLARPRLTRRCRVPLAAAPASARPAPPTVTVRRGTMTSLRRPLASGARRRPGRRAGGGGGGGGGGSSERLRVTRGPAPPLCRGREPLEGARRPPVRERGSRGLRAAPVPVRRGGNAPLPTADLRYELLPARPRLSGRRFSPLWFIPPVHVLSLRAQRAAINAGPAPGAAHGGPGGPRRPLRMGSRCPACERREGCGHAGARHRVP